MRGFQDGGSFGGAKESKADEAVRLANEKAEVDLRKLVSGGMRIRGKGHGP